MLDAFLRARYCPDALHRSFELGFGEMTLNDVNGSRLIVPAVNLTQGRPHIFRSCHIPESLADRDVRIMDMLVAATAAPTYFPHKEINGQAYADGGLWTVDPSMLSFAEGMRIRRDCQRGQCDPSFNMEDIALLSIGTGNASYSLCPPGSDAGMLYWAQHVADLMTTVQVAGVHEPLKFLLGDNFHHLNFDMNQKWPLDGIENLPRLFDLGKQHARDAYSTLTERFLGHSRKPFVPYGVEDLTGNAS
jgi:patatin-like phospholipase/acyl hydrolase